MHDTASYFLNYDYKDYDNSKIRVSASSPVPMDACNV
jgi:hypothetical protein